MRSLNVNQAVGEAFPGILVRIVGGLSPVH